MTCLGEPGCAATGQLSLSTAIMTTAEYYSWYLERSSLLLNDERATDMLLCDKHKETTTDSHACYTLSRMFPDTCPLLTNGTMGCPLESHCKGSRYPYMCCIGRSRAQVPARAARDYFAILEFPRKPKSARNL